MKIHKLAACAAIISAFSVASAAEVEVLHYWTSGGEAKSAATLKKMMQSKGVKWKDFAVAGGGGDNAATALKSRVLSGKAPTAAQVKGPAIQEWGTEGVLANIDSVAKTESWDSKLPAVVANVMKYKGNYVAAPVNVHRVNWLYASPVALKKAGVTTMPKNYAEFFAAADKLKKAGLIAVAHGGQNWQDFTMFESVALGVGGTNFYKNALVKLDPKALNSSTMKKVFETFRKIKSYTDSASTGRDWNLTTALVMQGKAGFQFMGDWAKGEFVAAGKKPGKDFFCAAAPNTANAFTFNIDSFVFYKQKDSGSQKAQAQLASAVMSPAFQEVFNLNKGSIPAHTGVAMTKFDACAKLSNRDFLATAKSGGLVPSIAHGMAVNTAAEGAMKDVVSQFWNSDSMTVDTAMKRLAAAAKTK